MVFRQAVETYTADHLAEPRLGPDLLAARFKVSRRTLYGLFVPVSSLMRERRLPLSARELRTPGHPGVLAVALRAGFNDAAHVSRLFKKRLGMSPA